MSRSTIGHQLNKLGSIQVSDAIYQVPMPPSLFVLELDILSFTLYGNDGHLGHVTQLICVNFITIQP